jgi:hypothetical protein
VSERWVDEIRKLRSLEVPDEVWERALHGSSPETPDRPSRRWLAAGVAVAVFVAGAAVAWLALAPRSDSGPAIQPTPTFDPSSVADVAVVNCDESGASTSTPVVRAQPDGIHVVFVNTGNYREFYFPTSEFSPFEGHGGLLKAGRNEALTFNGPGEFLAGCFRRAADEGHITDPGYITLEAVDPDHLWTPTQPQCQGTRGHRTVIHRDLPSSVSLNNLVRTVPGLVEGDRILRPGYPEEPWIIEPRVVIRDGRVVARITLWEPSQGSLSPTGADWKLWVYACPGSGIGSIPTG